VVDAGKRAASDVADYVSAGTLGGESDLSEGVGYINEIGDGEPVELDVLPGSDIG
jgi:hypothetical protein